MTNHISVSGFLVYARTTDRVLVTLQLPERWELSLPVTCTIGAQTMMVHVASLSPAEGRAPLIMTLVNGNKIFIAARDVPVQLQKHKWAERRDKAERASLPILIAASLLALTLFGGLLYWGLPKLSDRLAAYLPETLITQISDATLLQLDTVFLAPSQLPDARQEALQDAYQRLLAQSGINKDIPLLFRKSIQLGANALALPGGPIIILDELVEIAPSDDGIYGVLAHELAHVTLGHNRKQLARNSLFSLLAVMTGFNQDLGLGSELVKAVIFSGYSRQFEEEADKVARLWMRQAGYDEAAFDDMLIALYTHDCKAGCADNGSGKPSGLFDSHPSLSERLSFQ